MTWTSKQSTGNRDSFSLCSPASSCFPRFPDRAARVGTPPPEPMTADCRIAVVLPIYNENPHSVLALLESLVEGGLPREQFEVVAIVNNGPDCSTAVRQAQEAVLSMPVWTNAIHSSALSDSVLERCFALKSSITAHVIDCSSPGCEIDDCNVGKARNVGVAHACSRFLKDSQAGGRGVVFQTDADSRVPAGYLESLLGAFEKAEIPPYRAESDSFLILNSPEATVVGVLGGIDYQLRLDGDAPDDAPSLTSELQTVMRRADYFFLHAQYQEALDQFLGEKAPTSKHSYGANMSATVSALCYARGILPASTEEDLQLGDDLRNYAVTTGGFVVDDRSLRIVTDFRLSTRTDGSIGKHILATPLIEEAPLLVPSFRSEEFEAIPLTGKLYEDLRSAIRQQPFGSIKDTYLDHLELMRMHRWLRREAGLRGVPVIAAPSIDGVI